jgi:acyl transferase domain-containing protein
VHLRHQELDTDQTTGFGGTNAHAIIESYEVSPNIAHTQGTPSLMPLNISAHNERALRESLIALLDFLRGNESTCLRDLTWTYHNRKSVMPVRRSVPASSVDALCSHLMKEIEALSSPTLSTAVKAETKDTETRFLGVFTGQGSSLTMWNFHLS